LNLSNPANVLAVRLAAYIVRDGLVTPPARLEKQPARSS
jgi:hypothetical protein